MRLVTQLLCLAFVHTVSTLTCLDESGNPVEWWVAFKIPHDGTHTPGEAYYYADTNTGMKLSSYTMNETSSGAMANTLNQVYNNANSLGYVFYNDEPPNESTKSGGGHSKGVVGFTSSNGFWLMHSAPKFPYAPPGPYEGIQHSETYYGQNFMCVSVSNPDDVGSMLRYVEPHIYGSRKLSDMSSYPNLAALINGQFYSNGAQNNTMSINLQAGTTVTVFAKNVAWGSDLYEYMIAPYLRADLVVETWCRHPCLSTYCTPTYDWDVLDVVTMGTTSGNWKRTEDHSKWAVGVNSAWYCASDINRMQSQRKRGGSAMCIQNAGVRNAVVGWITDYSKCN